MLNQSDMRHLYAHEESRVCITLHPVADIFVVQNALVDCFKVCQVLEIIFNDAHGSSNCIIHDVVRNLA